MGLKVALKVSYFHFPYSILLPKSKFTPIKCFHDLKTSIIKALYVTIQVSVVVKYFQARLFVFNVKQSEIKGLFNLEFLNSGFRDDAPSCSTHGSFALRWFFAFLFDGFPG